MLVCGLLFGCSQTPDGDDTERKPQYTQISQEEAKLMMEENDGLIIVDVRRQDEYDGGHIPNAVCIPNESIENEMPAGLPDKQQVILVYCRSGNRSKQAAQKLADMGYANVYEFGGIIDWTGDVVTD
ncbi:MAG: rhodanese-like domain-containing protein [Clostridia bacterium]|nr:rhodanese-like domain-containing protein [Clostridia bacterium]